MHLQCCCNYNYGGLFRRTEQQAVVTACIADCTSTITLTHTPAGVALAGSAPSDNDDFEDRAGYSHVWSHVPAKQMAMLSSCQRVANKLSVDVAGSTAFCPVNWVSRIHHWLGRMDGCMLHS